MTGAIMVVQARLRSCAVIATITDPVRQTSQVTAKIA
jgi:hypothetical protein